MRAKWRPRWSRKRRAARRKTPLPIVIKVEGPEVEEVADIDDYIPDVDPDNEVPLAMIEKRRRTEPSDHDSEIESCATLGTEEYEHLREREQELKLEQRRNGELEGQSLGSDPTADDGDIGVKIENGSIIIEIDMKIMEQQQDVEELQAGRKSADSAEQEGQTSGIGDGDNVDGKIENEPIIDTIMEQGIEEVEPGQDKIEVEVTNVKIEPEDPEQGIDQGIEEVEAGQDKIEVDVTNVKIEPEDPEQGIDQDIEEVEPGQDKIEVDVTNVKIEPEDPEQGIDDKDEIHAFFAYDATNTQEHEVDEENEIDEGEWEEWADSGDSDGSCSSLFQESSDNSKDGGDVVLNLLTLDFVMITKKGCESHILPGTSADDLLQDYVACLRRATTTKDLQKGRLFVDALKVVVPLGWKNELYEQESHYFSEKLSEDPGFFSKIPGAHLIRVLPRLDDYFKELLLGQNDETFIPALEEQLGKFKSFICENGAKYIHKGVYRPKTKNLPVINEVELDQGAGPSSSDKLFQQ